MPPDLGSHIGSYRLLRQIGEGGTSTVYLACQPGREGTVALKLLRRDLRGDARMVARFMREARNLARLRHPNIVQVLDHGQTIDGQPFTVLEHVDGENLQHHLDRQGRLPWDLVVELGTQLLRGLAAVHAAGLVHRDVKPKNCMIVTPPDGRPRIELLDFGIAKDVHVDAEGFTLPHTILGTPGYMAPEQALMRDVDARTDVYGAGATLFELLAGSPPFDTNRPTTEVIADHLHRPPPSIFERCPSLEAPLEVDAFFTKCLARAPAHRFRSAEEMLAELERLGRCHELPSTLVTHRSSLEFPPTRRREFFDPGFRRGVIAGVLLSTMFFTGMAVGSQASAASTERCGK